MNDYNTGLPIPVVDEVYQCAPLGVRYKVLGVCHDWSSDEVLVRMQVCNMPREKEWIIDLRVFRAPGRFVKVIRQSVYF